MAEERESQRPPSDSDGPSRPPKEDHRDPEFRARAIKVLIGTAFIVAAAGFLSGTRTAPALEGYTPAPPHPENHVRPAPMQADMERMRYAERRQQQAQGLANLRPPQLDENTPRATAAERAATVAARAEHRAYAGAPPTIPHPVDTFGPPACLGCHENGADIEGRIAPAMSHRAYTSCVQCHASENGLPFIQEPLAPAFPQESNFAGEPEPGAGQRAWVGAPPTMPHRSFMRENCASCHATAASGITTSHPWRQSCSQCHAPSASLDQRPPNLNLPALAAPAAGAQ